MKFEPTLHKLSNGVTVLLDPMDLETANVKVNFSTGARDEAPHEHGLTHFCEHILCKGTKRFPTQKIIDDYMNYNAISRNAYTSNDSIAFHGRVLADNINVLIDFLGEQIQNSLLLPEKIDTERGVVRDEIRRYADGTGEQFGYFISGKLFNYADGSALKTLGNVDNINNFTREQILDFLSRRLSANNCIVAISGKIIDQDAVLKCLEETFGSLPVFDVPENKLIEYTPTVAHRKKSEQKNIRLRILFPDIWAPTLENRFKNMCVAKFERYLRDRVYETVRRENGLVYGFSMTGYGNEILGVTGFATETAPENLEKLVALIAHESYKTYYEQIITDEDLERYRRKNKLGDADWLESASRRNDKLIGFYCQYDQVYDFSETVKMSDSVTAADVQQNTRGYFDGPMSIITQGVDFDADLKSIWQDNFK